MTSSAAGPVSIVTGGARGIGAAIAGLCAAEGPVVVTDIDDAAGHRLAAALGDRASFVHLDVTDEDAVAAIVDRTVARLGRLDRFFANAGAVGVVGAIESIPLDAWRATTDLLLTSVFLSVKHAVRVMRPQRSGAIVCTSSVASIRGGLGPHVYTTMKHGVRGLVQSVAVDIAPDGLTINAVAPGKTVSSLSAGLMAGDKDDTAAAYARLAQVSSSGVPTTSEDIAEAAVFLSRSPRINGATLVVDGADDVQGTAGRHFYSG